LSAGNLEINEDFATSGSLEMTTEATLTVAAGKTASFD
jgi:hypothetical protein